MKKLSYIAIILIGAIIIYLVLSVTSVEAPEQIETTNVEPVDTVSSQDKIIIIMNHINPDDSHEMSIEEFNDAAAEIAADYEYYQNLTNEK